MEKYKFMDTFIIISYSLQLASFWIFSFLKVSDMSRATITYGHIRTFLTVISPFMCAFKSRTQKLICRQQSHKN